MAAIALVAAPSRLTTTMPDQATSVVNTWSVHQSCKTINDRQPLPPTSLITWPTPPRPTWPNHQTNLLDLSINRIDLGDQVRICTLVQVAGREIILEDKVGVVWDYMAQLFHHLDQQ